MPKSAIHIYLTFSDGQSFVPLGFSHWNFSLQLYYFFFVCFLRSTKSVPFVPTLVLGKVDKKIQHKSRREGKGAIRRENITTLTGGDAAAGFSASPLFSAGGAAEVSALFSGFLPPVVSFLELSWK